jgi:hypothetical protein
MSPERSNTIAVPSVEATARRLPSTSNPVKVKSPLEGLEHELLLARLRVPHVDLAGSRWDGDHRAVRARRVPFGVDARDAALTATVERQHRIRPLRKHVVDVSDDPFGAAPGSGVMSNWSPPGESATAPHESTRFTRSLVAMSITLV